MALRPPVLPPARRSKNPWDRLQSPPIWCEPMRAEMTEDACSANRRAALRASRLIGAGIWPSLLNEIDLDRLVRCGACQWSGLGVDMGVIMKALAEEVIKRMEQIEGMDWERGDEEVSRERQKETAKRWNEAHREQRVEYMREYRRWKSIMKIGR